MKKQSSISIISLTYTLCVTLIIGFLVIYEKNVPILNALELKSYDARFRMRGPEKPSGDVVILGIDDKSLDAIGRWPWSRSLLGEIIFMLRQKGAEAVGVDLILSEPEANPELERIQTLITAYTRLRLLNDNAASQAFFNEMVEASEGADNDGYLANAIHEAGSVVMAAALFADNDAHDKEKPDGAAGEEALLRISNAGAAEFLMSSQDGIFPIPLFRDAAAGVGFVNVAPNPDGAVRRGIAAMTYKEETMLSLPLALATQYLSVQNKDIRVDDSGELAIGEYNVPIYRNGLFNINYYGPHFTIPTYSVLDLATDRAPDDAFNGKMAIIGGAAVGLGDHWATPYVGDMMGVEIQATIADNFISQRFLVRPSWMKYAEAAAICLVGVLMGLLFPRISIGKGILLFFLLMMATVSINQYLFQSHGIVAGMIFPLLEILLIGSGIFIFRYMTEGREKRILKEAFLQYMNPSVVNRIIKQPEHLALGGEKKELTVLFSDIRDFTGISEKLKPEDLVHFMNLYLSAMTEIVLKENGTLDKYIGDAIMCFFGAPEEQPDHALRACASAVRMIGELKARQYEWKNERMAAIKIGVGINSGPMVVGNMGSQKRFDYTVMGDAVNLASRLEGLTKFYGVNIIAGEHTQRVTKDGFVFRELDLVRVKGKEEPVRIYELLAEGRADARQMDLIETFEEGLDLYRRREWENAIQIFSELKVRFPDDGPSALYIERCREMSQVTVSADWDGVYRSVQK